MLVTPFIEKKQRGESHTEAELTEFFQGYLKKEIPDYQVSAWLMAVFLKGMTPQEVHSLTQVMWKSGVTLTRNKREEDCLPGDFWIDKHSTGGVGDKTSLLLVPLVISVCRRKIPEHKIKIPMVSGRGLGFSGGTLDKLESVPEFKTDLPLEKATALLDKNDFFMIGQTAEMAPADKLLYALRDVTATVACEPLIVASILSKKFAENLDALVLDVKVGHGAFRRTEKEGKSLAKALVHAAKNHGIKAKALLTRMDEPLGYKVGHALEIEECAEFLSGKKREQGLGEVTLALAASMVRFASKNKLDLKTSMKYCEDELSTENPYHIFCEMFESQGGNITSFLESRQKTKAGLKSIPVTAPNSGYVSELRADKIGALVVSIGGGRVTKLDAIDTEVGIEFFKKVGDPVKKEEIIATVFYRLDESKKIIQDSINEWLFIQKKKPAKRSLVLEVIQ